MEGNISRKIIYDNRIEWVNESGQRHREDGPALVYTTDRVDSLLFKRECWYLNGKRHREDGPAITTHRKPTEYVYWLKGRRFYSEKAWRTELQKNYPQSVYGKPITLEF